MLQYSFAGKCITEMHHYCVTAFVFLLFRVLLVGWFGAGSGRLGQGCFQANIQYYA